ncbi:MAG: hypothetical protein QXE01_06250 [Sulfolobales archaeon]
MLASSLAASMVIKIGRDVLERVLPGIVDLLAPSRIDLKVVEYYFRKAARLGALRYLDPLERSLLIALRIWLSKGYKLRSMALIDIARRIIARIELQSLRGRAIAIGALIALKRGILELLRRVEELLVLGLQFINMPTPYRTL